MAYAYKPVERHLYTVCHNLKCSMCDKRARICMTNIAVCRDRQVEEPKPTK